MMLAGVFRVFGAAADIINDTVDSAGGDRASIKDVITPIIFMVFGLVGIVAAIMIILGGVQYSTSQGDSQKVKKAKDTIMYGIIGMVVALLAFSITAFVLSSVFA